MRPPSSGGGGQKLCKNWSVPLQPWPQASTQTAVCPPPSTRKPTPAQPPSSPLGLVVQAGGGVQVHHLVVLGSQVVARALQVRHLRV